MTIKAYDIIDQKKEELKKLLNNEYYANSKVMKKFEEFEDELIADQIPF